MAYADFDYYKSVYKGGAVPEAAFECVAERASEYLDVFTGGMAATAESGAAEAVKKCCCAVAEELYASRLRAADGLPDGGALKAETVGSWHREFELSADAVKTEEEKLYNAAKLYLSRWGLLYRGVRPCVH